MTIFQSLGATFLCGLAAASLAAVNAPLPLLNDPAAIRGHFRDFSNFYFLADRLAEFDPAAHAEKIARAKDSSEHGLPKVRALFVKFPDDPGSWKSGASPIQTHVEL